MKTLYLVRHAKSSWKYPELSDHDRPLNKRGKRDAPMMGKRLLSLNISPDTMISSTASRAYATAQEIASKIGFPTDQIIPNSDLYHADPSEILEIIQEVKDKYSSTMIFGHNPSFTWIANKLANLNIDNIPTCGVVCVGFPVNCWSEVDYGQGKLVFFDYPKKDR